MTLKTFSNKKHWKVNKIDTLENSLSAKLKSMKLEHSKDLVLFCAKFFKIKSAVTNNTKSGFHRIRLGLCLNCTLTNSNFSHGFVCGSLDYKNLLSSQSISKNTSRNCPKRNCATHCKRGSTTLYESVIL